MGGARAVIVAWAVLVVGGAFAQGPEEFPEMPKPSTARRFETRPGQFEIVAVDSKAAQAVLNAAAATWEHLRGVLDLPARYPAAVVVRVVPESQWREPAIFNVIVEAGGLVSVRVRWSAELTQVVLHRALAQALIMRQAVAWHGLSPDLNAPLWLEQACAAWVMGREQPALVDMWQQQAGTIPAPALSAVLSWQRGDVETLARVNASYWLLVFLQAESGAGRRWPALLRELLKGGDPLAKVGAGYRSSFSDAQTRELWWQVGFQHHRRARLVPMEAAAESRGWLADASRWWVSRDGREEILSPGDLFVHRDVAWVRAELELRLVKIQQQLGRIHPFYNNAALSLGRLYEAARDGRAADFKRAHEDFLRDAVEGRQLEDETKAALDEMEAATTGVSGR